MSFVALGKFRSWRGTQSHPNLLLHRPKTSKRKFLARKSLALMSVFFGQQQIAEFFFCKSSYRKCTNQGTPEGIYMRVAFFLFSCVVPPFYLPLCAAFFRSTLESGASPSPGGLKEFPEAVFTQTGGGGRAW